MIEQQLTTQAAEIADAGHAGWGNTMLDAAAEIVRLRAAAAAERKRWIEAVLGELDGNGQAKAIVAYATKGAA